MSTSTRTPRTSYREAMIEPPRQGLSEGVLRLVVIGMLAVIVVCPLLVAAVWVAKTDEANAERNANAETQARLALDSDQTKCRSELANRGVEYEAAADAEQGRAFAAILDYIAEQRVALPTAEPLNQALINSDAATRARVVSVALCDEPDTRKRILADAAARDTGVPIPPPLELPPPSSIPPPAGTTSTTLGGAP